MLVSDAPNIGTGLLLVHAVISRGLQVATEHAQGFAQRGWPDASTQEGFLNYAGTFVVVLDTHHLVEEELAFPRLRDRFPEAPFDLLLAQHRDIVAALLEVQSALADVAGGAPQDRALSELSEALRRVDPLWHPHRQLEEELFTEEKMQTRLGAEEQAELMQLIAAYDQEHATPDYLVVPFMLYNLPPAERALFARELPPFVTEQLVPLIWRPKWASMAPFLLT